MIAQLAFAFLFLIAFGFAFRKYIRIRRNILLGKDEVIGGNSGHRWKNVLLVALGQGKMFKNFIPAILHLFIYVAFLVTQIELIEIIIDGFTGTHRFFSVYLNVFYTFLINFIEILSLLALIGTVVFLIRRNILKVSRFDKPEMKGWPAMDANIILFGELVLIFGIFTMNGTDVLLQEINPLNYPQTGHLILSAQLGPALFGGFSDESLMFLERFGWWMHITAVFGFIVYLPYSKHLHIILAFPNTWYARLTPKGQMNNMPEIEKEVRSMLGLSSADDIAETLTEIPEFGAKDVFDLSWKNIMDAYSCTECGRCTAACPANLTGKKLSPRKIMMDVRDRADEIGRNIDSGNADYFVKDSEGGSNTDLKNYQDGKSLFDYISPEEIHACTTCNACVEACPVLIDPLDIILSMRRHEILTQSAGPAEWIPMFTSMENNGSVWQMNTDREQWTKE